MPDESPPECSGIEPAVDEEWQRSVPPAGRRGHLPKPPGSYHQYREIIEEAVASDARPSPDLIEANKRLSWWEAYLGIGDVRSFPTALHLAITDICNARCLFCSYAPEHSTHRRIALSDIARTDWLKFVDRFYPNSALGEPLVHPQIVEIFTEVRRHAPFIKMGITTNAALLTDPIIEATAGHLYVMAVSLNAARKETYERVMAPLKWDVTLGNLKRLTDRKRMLGSDRPDVQGSIVVHRHNLDELPEFPGVLRSVGIDRMRILVMNVPRPIESRKLYGREDLIHHHPAHANRIFGHLAEECERHRISLVSPLPRLAEA